MRSWPGQRAHRRAVRPELRRRRRELRAARRCRQRRPFLSEIVGAQAFEARHLSMESMYEYGSRAGVWRILREFERRGLPLTVFGVVDGAAAPSRADAGLRRAAATRSPATAGAGSTTSTWPRPTEREHIGPARRIIRELTGGAWPLGWYTGRDSPNTQAPGRRPRRLRIRQRLLRRRPAVLDAGREERRHARAAPGRARTRSTPTTCASRRRRASTPATTSSPT